MTIMDVDVARYSLTVDARETLSAVLASGNARRGAKLDRILQASLCGVGTADAAFAVAPFVRVDDDDFRPGPDAGDDWPDVADRDESGVLAAMERAGLVETFDVFSEGVGTSYLNEGRVLTAVRVLRPFAVVTVAYRWTGARLGYADRWTITDRTPVVGTGTYLVGMVGDFAMTYVGATGLDATGDEPGMSDDLLFMWLVEQEGFLASTCLAGCDACGGRWEADGGSWHFQPEYASDADAFDFDDTEDHDGDTVACPCCATGRVGFLVV
ncbi:hypothetical protein [Streptomonospora arabica]|uniref:Uncharacterized protein n=1 Tax=Streptomonospora arabica TaxID=412417 RepID=A0ABV9SLM3_9ACTN